MPLQQSIDTQKFLAAAKVAIDDAIETHRRMGRAIVTWEDGAIKWVQPHEIEPRLLSSEIEAQNAQNDP